MAKTKRPRREAFFVRYQGSHEWTEETQRIGKPYPKNTKPIDATCAMLVTGDVVCFSLLRPSKKAADKLKETIIQYPAGPIRRLEKRTREVVTSKDQRAEVFRAGIEGALHVEIEGDKSSENSSVVWTSHIDRNSSGAYLRPLAGRPDFRLPKGVSKLSAFTFNATLDRAIGIGCVQYFGRPDSIMKVQEAAEEVIAFLVSLSHFRVLTQIDQLTGPPEPLLMRLLANRATTITNKSQGKCERLRIPVWLVSDLGLLESQFHELPPRDDEVTVECEEQAALLIKDFLANLERDRKRFSN